MEEDETSPTPITDGIFRVTTATEARSLTDGVCLSTLNEIKTVSDDGGVHKRPRVEIDHRNKRRSSVILPWLGFGTYRLGKQQALKATYQALQVGYRSIDTAFIYGGETTEGFVGQAVQQALAEQIIERREDIFITTKHWRKYHGYDASLECLALSLKRLKLDYVDLWLMHWPGPSYEARNRMDSAIDVDPWQYATTKNPQDMIALRSETWRAMEDAYRQGLTRSIGVSNMSVSQLKNLKESATLWPPAVNQVELHPLRPQTELLEYCRKEGIVVQAYASLGGQDTGKAVWAKLLGDHAGSKNNNLNLMLSQPVIDLAKQLNATAAQTLLRWGLQHECVLIPKTSSKSRLEENARSLYLKMTQKQADSLRKSLLHTVEANNPDEQVDQLTRLCWRSDPLRHIDFD